MKQKKKKFFSFAHHCYKACEHRSFCSVVVVVIVVDYRLSLSIVIYHSHRSSLFVVVAVCCRSSQSLFVIICRCLLQLLIVIIAIHYHRHPLQLSSVIVCYSSPSIVVHCCPSPSVIVSSHVHQFLYNVHQRPSVRLVSSIRHFPSTDVHPQTSIH